MSEPVYLLDTGPLAALFDPRDQYHEWAATALPQIAAPLATCEPVLTESFYLLSKTHNGVDLLLEFCATGSLVTDFRVLDHLSEIREFLRKYRNIPMSLADACLLLLAEQHPAATIITTDLDFLVYRSRNRRQLRVLAPFTE